ncbi:hypothetical protein CGCSCA5_v007218 [Colletotrichum siamense]|nr:hypothetical protein CGCSCA5_v007218 [Colletotrichum siamense]
MRRLPSRNSPFFGQRKRKTTTLIRSRPPCSHLLTCQAANIGIAPGHVETCHHNRIGRRGEASSLPRRGCGCTLGRVQTQRK